MFCDRCGANVPLNQAFCGKCGKPLGNAFPVAPAAGRVAQHVRLLGILWLAMSAINLIGAGALMVLAHTVFGRFHAYSAPHGPAFLHPLFLVLSGFTFLKAAAGFAAGWGLLQREPWARMLTIVLSVISLFNIPFGTALGIYGLWILLPAESEREYELTSRQAA